MSGVFLDPASPAAGASLRRAPAALIFAALAFFSLALRALPAAAQCATQMDSPSAAATCVERRLPASALAAFDPNKVYKLDELIAIAESRNPKTRIAWERARQAAEQLKIARSAYYPDLALLAFFGDERIINPFPKPLAPRGYTMAELPTVAPAIALEYVVFDSGARGARVDSSRAERLAAAAAFQRTHQDVAYEVVRAYYNLITGEQRLTAARQILTTAKTTEDAAEARLQNGRSTLPDVLNARAARAQAAYDLESADGAVRLERVALREALGVEPSEEIEVAAPSQTPAPSEVTESIQQLVSLALTERPDLKQLQEELRRSQAEIRQAKAAQMPSLTLGSQIGETALWPTSDYGRLGSATQTTWSVGLNFRWDLFTGGRLRAESALARSQERERVAEIGERQDKIGREVWSAYLSFRTAVRQREAAETLLQSAETSYNASLEAYQYGVKNLIDVVTAEKQLAEARVAHVQADSSVWLSAVSLEYATGHLLHPGNPLTAAGPAPRKN